MAARHHQVVQQHRESKEKKSKENVASLFQLVTPFATQKCPTGSMANRIYLKCSAFACRLMSRVVGVDVTSDSKVDHINVGMRGGCRLLPLFVGKRLPTCLVCLSKYQSIFTSCVDCNPRMRLVLRVLREKFVIFFWFWVNREHVHCRVLTAPLAPQYEAIMQWLYATHGFVEVY